MTTTYYSQNADTVNKNKIMNRVKKGRKVNAKTIEKYNWSASDILLLNENLRNKTITKTALRKKRIIKITKTDVTELIAGDDKIKDNTKLYWSQILNNFMQVFPKDETFSDIFINNNDVKIIKMIQAKYDNAGTQLKHLHFILKIYSLSKPFATLLTKQRYTYLKNTAFDIDQVYRASRITQKNLDETDYMEPFTKMFENELMLRNSEPSSMNHLVSMMYTIACYTKRNLSASSLIYVPRVDELESVYLVDDDKLMKDEKKNYYNYETGRLVINNLKTVNDGNTVFRYNHIINPLAKEYIKDNINKRVPSKRTFLFPFKKQNIELKLTKYVLPNRVLRKAYQNVYDKNNLRTLESMSRPMAHSIAIANSDYLNSLTYSAEEIEENKILITHQMELSA
jgi:hypothetical protein